MVRIALALLMVLGSATACSDAEPALHGTAAKPRGSKGATVRTVTRKADAAAEIVADDAVTASRPTLSRVAYTHHVAEDWLALSGLDLVASDPGASGDGRLQAFLASHADLAPYVGADDLARARQRYAFLAGDAAHAMSADAARAAAAEIRARFLSGVTVTGVGLRLDDAADPCAKDAASGEQKDFNACIDEQFKVKAQATAAAAAAQDAQIAQAQADAAAAQAKAAADKAQADQIAAAAAAAELQRQQLAAPPPTQPPPTPAEIAARNGVVFLGAYDNHGWNLYTSNAGELAGRSQSSPIFRAPIDCNGFDHMAVFRAHFDHPGLGTVFDLDADGPQGSLLASGWKRDGFAFCTVAQQYPNTMPLYKYVDSEYGNRIYSLNLIQKPANYSGPYIVGYVYRP